MVSRSRSRRHKTLRDWRQSAGLTQHEAASLFSVTQGTYHKWESGALRVGPDYLLGVMRTTGVPVEQLVGMTRKQTQTRAVA